MNVKIMWAALLVVAAGLVQAQPKEGEAVSYDSPQLAGGTLVIRGILYKPTGPAKGSVVIVHGSGGWSDGREGHYGRALSAAGYAALAIDTFGPRSVSNTAADQGKLSTFQQMMDAFAARTYLLSLGYPADKTAIMGFSRGGTVSVQAADRTFLPQVAERFKLSLPFYAGCTARPREPKPASTMFMVLAEKDEWVGVKSCQDLATAYAAAGGKVTSKVYPNTAHGFDGDPANTRLFRVSDAETFVDCVALVEPDGTLGYGGKKFAATDSSGLLDEMRKSCVKKGGSVWTNLGQKEAATKDAIEFLDANL